MSKYVEVRGVKIGEGVPKICVPIVGKTKEEILAAARSFEDVALDVVEWRVDWFAGGSVRADNRTACCYCGML